MARFSSSEDIYFKQGRVHQTNETPLFDVLPLLHSQLQNPIWKFLIGEVTIHRHNINGLPYRVEKFVNGVKAPVYGSEQLPEKYLIIEDEQEKQKRIADYKEYFRGKILESDEYHSMDLKGIFIAEIDLLLHEAYRYLEKLYPNHYDDTVLLTRNEFIDGIINAAALLNEKLNIIFYEWLGSYLCKQYPDCDKEFEKLVIRGLFNAALKQQFAASNLLHRIIASEIDYDISLFKNYLVFPLETDMKYDPVDYRNIRFVEVLNSYKGENLDKQKIFKLFHDTENPKIVFNAIDNKELSSTFIHLSPNEEGVLSFINITGRKKSNVYDNTELLGVDNAYIQYKETEKVNFSEFFSIDFPSDNYENIKQAFTMGSGINFSEYDSSKLEVFQSFEKVYNYQKVSGLLDDVVSGNTDKLLFTVSRLQKNSIKADLNFLCSLYYNETIPYEAGSPDFSLSPKNLITKNAFISKDKKTVLLLEKKTSNPASYIEEGYISITLDIGKLLIDDLVPFKMDRLKEGDKYKKVGIIFSQFSYDDFINLNPSDIKFTYVEGILEVKDAIYLAGNIAVYTKSFLRLKAIPDSLPKKAVISFLEFEISKNEDNPEVKTKLENILSFFKNLGSSIPNNFIQKDLINPGKSKLFINDESFILSVLSAELGVTNNEVFTVCDFCYPKQSNIKDINLGSIYIKEFFVNTSWNENIDKVERVIYTQSLKEVYTFEFLDFNKTFVGVSTNLKEELGKNNNLSITEIQQDISSVLVKGIFQKPNKFYLSEINKDLAVGFSVHSRYVPEGTYILSIEDTTITLSENVIEEAKDIVSFKGFVISKVDLNKSGFTIQNVLGKREANPFYRSFFPSLSFPNVTTSSFIEQKEIRNKEKKNIIDINETLVSLNIDKIHIQDDKDYLMVSPFLDYVEGEFKKHGILSRKNNIGCQLNLQADTSGTYTLGLKGGYTNPALKIKVQVDKANAESGIKYVQLGKSKTGLASFFQGLESLNGFSNFWGGKLYDGRTLTSQGQESLNTNIGNVAERHMYEDAYTYTKKDTSIDDILVDDFLFEIKLSANEISDLIHPKNRYNTYTSYSVYTPLIKKEIIEKCKIFFDRDIFLSDLFLQVFDVNRKGLAYNSIKGGIYFHLPVKDETRQHTKIKKFKNVYTFLTAPLNLRISGENRKTDTFQVDPNFLIDFTSYCFNDDILHNISLGIKDAFYQESPLRTIKTCHSYEAKVLGFKHDGNIVLSSNSLSEGINSSRDVKRGIPYNCKISKNEFGVLSWEEVTENVNCFYEHTSDNDDDILGKSRVVEFKIFEEKPLVHSSLFDNVYFEQVTNIPVEKNSANEIIVPCTSIGQVGLAKAFFDVGITPDDNTEKRKVLSSEILRRNKGFKLKTLNVKTSEIPLRFKMYTGSEYSTLFVDYFGRLYRRFNDNEASTKIDTVTYYETDIFTTSDFTSDTKVIFAKYMPLSGYYLIIIDNGVEDIRDRYKVLKADKNLYTTTHIPNSNNSFDIVRSILKEKGVTDKLDFYIKGFERHFRETYTVLRDSIVPEDLSLCGFKEIIELGKDEFAYLDNNDDVYIPTTVTLPILGEYKVYVKIKQYYKNTVSLHPIKLSNRYFSRHTYGKYYYEYFIKNDNSLIRDTIQYLKEYLKDTSSEIIEDVFTFEKDNNINELFKLLVSSNANNLSDVISYFVANGETLFKIDPISNEFKGIKFPLEWDSFEGYFKITNNSDYVYRSYFDGVGFNIVQNEADIPFYKDEIILSFFYALLNYLLMVKATYKMPKYIDVTKGVKNNIAPFINFGDFVDEKQEQLTLRNSMFITSLNFMFSKPTGVLKKDDNIFISFENGSLIEVSKNIELFMVDIDDTTNPHSFTGVNRRYVTHIDEMDGGSEGIKEPYGYRLEAVSSVGTGKIEDNLLTSTQLNDCNLFFLDGIGLEEDTQKIIGIGGLYLKKDGEEFGQSIRKPIKYLYEDKDKYKVFSFEPSNDNILNTQNNGVFEYYNIYEGKISILFDLYEQSTGAEPKEIKKLYNVSSTNNSLIDMSLTPDLINFIMLNYKLGLNKNIIGDIVFCNGLKKDYGENNLADYKVLYNDKLNILKEFKGNRVVEAKTVNVGSDPSTGNIKLVLTFEKPLTSFEEGVTVLLKFREVLQPIFTVEELMNTYSVEGITEYAKLEKSDIEYCNRVYNEQVLTYVTLFNNVEGAKKLYNEGGENTQYLPLLEYCEQYDLFKRDGEGNYILQNGDKIPIIDISYFDSFFIKNGFIFKDLDINKEVYTDSFEKSLFNGVRYYSDRNGERLKKVYANGDEDYLPVPIFVEGIKDKKISNIKVHITHDKFLKDGEVLIAQKGTYFYMDVFKSTPEEILISLPRKEDSYFDMLYDCTKEEDIKQLIADRVPTDSSSNDFLYVTKGETVYEQMQNVFDYRVNTNIQDRGLFKRSVEYGGVYAYSHKGNYFPVKGTLKAEVVVETFNINNTESLIEIGTDLEKSDYSLILPTVEGYGWSSLLKDHYFENGKKVKDESIYFNGAYFDKTKVIENMYHTKIQLATNDTDNPFMKYYQHLYSNMDDAFFSTNGLLQISGDIILPPDTFIKEIDRKTNTIILNNLIEFSHKMKLFRMTFIPTKTQVNLSKIDLQNPNKFVEIPITEKNYDRLYLPLFVDTDKYASYPPPPSVEYIRITEPFISEREEEIYTQNLVFHNTENLYQSLYGTQAYYCNEDGLLYTKHNILEGKTLADISYKTERPLWDKSMDLDKVIPAYSPNFLGTEEVLKYILGGKLENPFTFKITLHNDERFSVNFINEFLRDSYFTLSSKNCFFNPVTGRGRFSILPQTDEQKALFKNIKNFYGNIYDPISLDKIRLTYGEFSFVANSVKDYNNALSSSTVEVTEASFLDENKKLVAYAFFPPIQYDSEKHHLALNLCIYKGVCMPMDDYEAMYNVTPEPDDHTRLGKPEDMVRPNLNF